MSQTKDPYDESLNNFQSLTDKPENYLNVNESLTKGLRTNLKDTYDFCKKQEIKSLKSDALPELIVRNFDLEQIWQQVELQNDSILTRSLLNTSKLLVNKEKLLFKTLEDKYRTLENDVDANENEDADADEDADTDDDSNDDAPPDLHSEDDDELASDASDSAMDQKQQTPTPHKKSIVDDEFFKLHEMENFLNAEEKRDNDPDSGNDSDSSNDENSIDLFQNMSDDDEDPVKTARYKDYFVEKLENAKPQKRNKFLEEFDSDEDEPKSSLQLRQERLQKKIEGLEEMAVSEKPWQLKGEITAESRPQNSLLEEIVEFDMSSRPAPVMTEQTTLQLEDIIKQRIKDKVFDSVERKAKPVESLLEYKKKLVLDQEKSKESLAQIYEKEYLEQKAALDPENATKDEEEPELHKEIRSMMGKLFNKLDALSNFHFTPKPAMPELKIVSNLPALSMEEVAPVAVSDAALLAPEEVKNKGKGEDLGKGERSKTDKNRERRKKKLKQSFHAKKKQKQDSLIDKMRPGLGNKYSKEKAKKMLEKVTKEANVDKMDESMGSKSVKSSKAFFSQLQDEVQTHISSKVHKKKKLSKPKSVATKIKL